MSAHRYRSGTRKAVLTLSWTTQQSCVLPGGPIRIRANRPGMVEPVFGTSVKRGCDASTRRASVREIIYVHHDRRSGWLITRNHTLRSRTRRLEEFHRYLLGEIRLILMERFLGAVVLPGHVTRSAKGTTLVLSVRPEDVKAAERERPRKVVPELSPLLILVPEERLLKPRISDRLSRLLRVQFVDGSIRPPERVVLQETPVPRAGRRREAITDQQALPWVLSAPWSWGADPQSGFRLVLDLVSACSRFLWEGRSGGALAGAEDSVMEPVPFDAADSAGEGIAASPRVAAGVRPHHVSGQCVVFAPALMKPLLLDPQAQAVLRLCDGQTSVAEMAEVAAEVFETDRVEVERRLRVLLAAMTSAGILEGRDGQYASVELASVLQSAAAAARKARAR